MNINRVLVETPVALYEINKQGKMYKNGVFAGDVQQVIELNIGSPFRVRYTNGKELHTLTNVTSVQAK